MARAGNDDDRQVPRLRPDKHFSKRLQLVVLAVNKQVSAGSWACSSGPTIGATSTSRRVFNFASMALDLGAKGETREHKRQFFPSALRESRGREHVFGLAAALI